MYNLTRAMLHLLFRFLLGISFFVSLGYMPTATAATYYTLTTKVSGSGMISKSPSASSYVSGSTVTLTASPSAGYKFSGWSGGGCSGTGTCKVKMTSNTTVTASFVANSYALTTTVSGSGTVSKSPSASSYASGTKVTLTASPSAGYKFSGWSGGSCSGTGTCTVTVTANTAVTASFVALSPVPNAPTLNTPSNGATNVSQASVPFSWSVANVSAAKVNSYRIVISQNSGFSGFTDTGTDTSSCSGTCFTTSTGTSTSYLKNMDLPGQTYYWKVRASGSGGVSQWSVTRSFTTLGSPIGAKVDSFVAKWTGKPTDFDGKYGYQCVDLMRRYATDVLGLNAELPAGDAYDIFAKTTSSKFVKIYKTPSGVPAKGDIIFWKKASANGNSGHVAIFVSGSTSTFTSFDQNFCTSSGSGVGNCAPRLVSHDYVSSGGVAGWLHPK